MAGINKSVIRAVFLLLYCLAAVTVRAAAPGSDGAASVEIFQEANSFFNQASELAARDPEAARDLYGKALLRFEQLVAEGVRNGRIYYNIGNVYFRQGDLGRAILNYRRAAQYIPGDVNLQQNLTYVLSQRQDKIEVRQKEKVLKTLLFFHYDLPARHRALIFAVFYALFWGLLTLRLYKPRPWLRWGLGVSTVVFLLFSGSLLADHYLQAQDRPGVIVAPQTLARKGDGESYQPSFAEPLHAGTEFSLIEERGRWLYIELTDGRRTWIKTGDAELV